MALDTFLRLSAGTARFGDAGVAIVKARLPANLPVLRYASQLFVKSALDWSAAFVT